MSNKPCRTHISTWGRPNSMLCVLMCATRLALNCASLLLPLSKTCLARKVHGPSQCTVLDANGQTASLKRLFFGDDHAKMAEDFLRNHPHGSMWKLLGCKGSKANKLYSSASSAVDAGQAKESHSAAAANFADHCRTLGKRFRRQN